MSEYQVSNKILLKGETNTGKTSFQHSILKHPFDPKCKSSYAATTPQ